MFMPNDFGNGGGAPQGMGGPFDLQAQLAALPPQIRAQVMARMGIPGGGMQPGMPDQGMNQTGAPMPPPQGGMRPGLPNQGVQSGPIRDPRQGPPGPPQPMPAPGSGPVGGNPWGRSQAGPVTSPLNAQGIAAQQGIYGGFDPGRQGQGSGMPSSGGGMLISDVPQNVRDLWANGGKSPFGGGPSGRAGEGVPAGWDGRAVDKGFSGPPAQPGKGPEMGMGGGKDPGYGYAIGATVGAKPFWTGPPGTEPPPADWGKGTPMPVFSDFNDRGRGGQMGGPKGPGYVGPADTGGQIFMPGDPRAPQGGDLKNPLTAGPGGGNTLTSMPAPVPNGNARPFRPQMSATDRAAAIAADKAMVGGAPPYVGKPKPMPQTDPPVAGTATDVKPLVGKPAPTPQQDPLQGATKPKPKPKPTLGRNYGQK